MRSHVLMDIAVRVIGNLVTDEDSDWIARVWRRAGAGRVGSTAVRHSADGALTSRLSETRCLHTSGTTLVFARVVRRDGSAPVDSMTARRASSRSVRRPPPPRWARAKK